MCTTSQRILLVVLMTDVIMWLLEGEPWVEYRTRIDLLGQSEDEAEVRRARTAMLSDLNIQSLLTELANWPGVVISSHKSAGQSFHKLSFLAELGLTKDDPPIGKIIKKIYGHTSSEGPFQLPTNIPMHFGGSGKEEWAWALCDAPTIIYSLIKFDLGKDDQLHRAVTYLAGLVRNNGWPCAISKELGNFRGPGRKDDPCPYATLIMLKMLAQLEEWRDSKETRIGAESLLNLWEKSRDLHPYQFYMGTDFRKLKAPFIWYDLLHVVDVLSHFTW
ncbi:MAG: hypothetical protein QG670_2852, partial [Thermoproteota archaeon]|nr:hypothetical protein [Thermoproteota archaeon]